MKKNRTLSLGLLAVVIAGGLILSCKDEFTDQDLINAQGLDSVQLSILVLNGSTSSILKSGKPGRTQATQGLAGMTVSLTDAKGKLITRTSDANGLVNFRALEPGSVAGVVSGTDYTTTNFIVSIRNTSENDPFTSAAVIIPVFETNGPNTAKVTGAITAELNLLNDTRENVPDGTQASFTIYQASIASDAAALAILTSVLGSSISAVALKNAEEIGRAHV